MRSVLFHIILVLGIVIPQLIIQQYWLILLDWFLVGVLVKSVGMSRVMIKSIAIQLVCSVLMLYISWDHLTYLQDVSIYYEMPWFTLFMVFLVFNAINVLAVMYLAQLLGKFIHRSMSS